MIADRREGHQLNAQVLAILAIYHDLILGFPSRQLARLLRFAAVDEIARANEEIGKLLAEQSERVGAVMADRELNKAERESLTAAITSEYASRMETLRFAAE